MGNVALRAAACRRGSQHVGVWPSAVETVNPTAAALDREIAHCVERLADREFEGPVSRPRSGAVVQSCRLPRFRSYYQRHPDDL